MTKKNLTFKCYNVKIAERLLERTENFRKIKYNFLMYQKFFRYIIRLLVLNIESESALYIRVL